MSRDCAPKGDYEQARAIIASLVMIGLLPTLVTANVLIMCYKNARLPEEAERVLEEMAVWGLRPDSYSFNTVLNAYCLAARHAEARKVFNRMCEMVLDDDCSYSTIIRILTPAEIPNILSQMQARGIACDLVTANSALNVYAEAGQGDQCELFIRTFMNAPGKPFCSSQTYTIVAKAFSKSGKPEEAERALRQAQRARLAVDTILFAVVADAYASTDPPRVTDVERIVHEGLRTCAKGHGADVSLFNALLKGYAHERPPQPNKVTAVLAQITQFGLTPSIVTVSIAADALCCAGMPNAAHDLVEDAKRNGLKPNATLYNTLIKGHAKCRCVINQGFCNCSPCNCTSPEAAMRLLNEMQSRGLQPDVVTLNTLVSSFCHAGRPMEARTIVDSVMMISEAFEGCTPDLQTFNTLLRGLLADPAGGAPDLGEVDHILRDIESLGLRPDQFTRHTIIECALAQRPLPAFDRVWPLLEIEFSAEGPVSAQGPSLAGEGRAAARGMVQTHLARMLCTVLNACATQNGDVWAAARPMAVRQTLRALLRGRALVEGTLLRRMAKVCGLVSLDAAVRMLCVVATSPCSLPSEALWELIGAILTGDNVRGRVSPTELGLVARNIASDLRASGEGCSTFILRCLIDAFRDADLVDEVRADSLRQIVADLHRRPRVPGVPHHQAASPGPGSGPPGARVGGSFRNQLGWVPLNECRAVLEPFALALDPLAVGMEMPARDVPGVDPSMVSTLVDDLEAVLQDLHARLATQLPVHRIPSNTPVTISVQGMTCSDCAARLETALYRVDGVRVVRAYPEGECVEVSHDANVRLKDLTEAVHRAGFTTAPVSADHTKAGLIPRISRRMAGLRASAPIFTPGKQPNPSPAGAVGSEVNRSLMQRLRLGKPPQAQHMQGVDPIGVIPGEMEQAPAAAQRHTLPPHVGIGFHRLGGSRQSEPSAAPQVPPQPTLLQQQPQGEGSSSPFF